MLCLADTHIALWLVRDSKKLPKKTAELMADPENDWYVSHASVWEVAIKHAKNPKKMPTSPREFLNACLVAGFKQLPIEPEHMYMLEHLPSEGVHTDPFDRMLLAQAKCNDFVLVTHDKAFLAYQDPYVRVY